MPQFLNSPAPFRPINPHGRKAVVRDVHGNEIDWKSPLSVPLYRVMVEDTKTKETIPAFPAMQIEFADALCAMVKKQIKNGFETSWSNPHVVRSS